MIYFQRYTNKCRKCISLTSKYINEGVSSFYNNVATDLVLGVSSHFVHAPVEHGWIKKLA